MKAPNSFSKRAAFSLVETLLSGAVSTIIGVAVFAMLNMDMMLSVRNFSVNLTNNQQRNVLDRIEQVIQQAQTMPTLIDTTGAATATTPAPGTTFDYYVGGPYVISVTGSLPSTTTSLTLTRTTNTVAVAPVPVTGDVLQINTAPSTVRARISTVVVGTTDGSGHQTITVTLAAALGAAITAPSSGALTGYLVHKVALIVMPTTSRNELRYYKNFETVTNLNDPTQYIVLTREVGMQTGDATPFSLSTLQSANFVSLSLRVRASNYDQRLLGKQADQFNTFSRVDCYIRPKINPL